MKNKEQKLLLFDFDGVVVDSLDFYETLVRDGLAAIGSPVVRTRDDFIALFDDNFYDALTKRGIDAAAFNRAVADVIPHADYTAIHPFDDLFPVLRELKDRCTLAVISSNSRFAIETLLEKTGCNDCFNDILGADETLSKVKKIKDAVDKWRVDKDAAYYIGDTVGDIKEAKEAGITVIAVTWGWHPRARLERARPDHIVDTPDELRKIVV